MSVYVDPLMNYGWRLGPSCHLTTDGPIEQLHEFAAKIGMKRQWFQGRPKSSIDHYDLTVKRRAVAVKLGAIELSRKESVAHWKSQRGPRLRTQ